MPQDDDVIGHLQRQDSRWTVVRLKDGSALRVYNIAWGYDFGDEYAHITTNISPFQDGASIDFFYTGEITEIVDEDSGRLIFYAK